MKPKKQVTWLVGDDCCYHAIIGGPVTSTGHTIKQIGILNGKPVAWVTGKSGCVAIEALSKDNE